MRCRYILLLTLALGPLACQPPLSAEPEWVQWFSYREIHDLAVAPNGEIMVVGQDMGEELTVGMNGPRWRPFVTRLDADGAVLDDWTGYEGTAQEVAVDDEGRAYVTFDALEGPQDSELRALDLDGSVRWSKRWDGDLWTQVAVVDDVVVVRARFTLEALELDGQPRWQDALPSTYPLVTTEDEIWVVDQRIQDGSLPPYLETFTWRYDARDGTRTEQILELPERRSLGTTAITPDGVLAITSADYSVRLSSLSQQGQLRWDHEISPAYDEGDLPMWVPRLMRVIADGRDAWIVGAQYWREDANGSHEAELRRLWLQRWSGEGEHEGTFEYAFEDPGVPDEPDPSVLARADCSSPYPEETILFGTSASEGVVLPDGSLLVAGQQGCRDSFVLRLAVDR